MHYESVVKLILNTPKGFWLSGPPPLRETLKDAMAFGKMTSVYPFSSAIGRGAGAEAGLRIGDAPGMKSRDLLVLKKRLGGFYILYTLFFKQPHAFANQIHMDAKDYVEVEHFEDALQQVFPKNNGIWKAYAFMLMRLKLNNAFAPESEEDKVSLNAGSSASPHSNSNLRFQGLIAVVPSCLISSEIWIIRLATFSTPRGTFTLNYSRSLRRSKTSLLTINLSGRPRLSSQNTRGPREDWKIVVGQIWLVGSLN